MQADSAIFQEGSTPERLVSGKLNYSGLQQPPFKERMPHVRRTAPRTEVSQAGGSAPVRLLSARLSSSMLWASALHSCGMVPCKTRQVCTLDLITYL